MTYFWQEKSYGLGNFIMATPMLKAMSNHIKKPIDVYFDSPTISSLFTDCKFINILNSRPATTPFASTHCPKRLKRESDYDAYLRIFARGMGSHNPYVDNVSTIVLNKEVDKKYVAVFHGCLGKFFLKRKDVGPKVRGIILSEIIKVGAVPVLLGNKADLKRFWRNMKKIRKK